MSTSALWKLSALNTPAGLIPSLMSREIDPGIMEYILKGDGKISPQFAANMHQRPSFRASAVAIAAGLTVMSSGFYAFAAAVDLYLAKLITGGGLDATSVHAKLSGSKGCIIPRRLVAEHKKQAVLDFDGYFLSSDGVTAPWAYTGSVALPAMTVAAEAFTLGPVAVNGAVVGAVSRFSIEWNYGEIVHGSGGETYDTFACYEHFAPRLSFRTSDPTMINTLGVGGVAQGGTASTFYLQKLATNTGGRVAAVTASHIKFTVSAGRFMPGPITENDEGETEMEVNVANLDDGTHSILGISLASAIT